MDEETDLLLLRFDRAPGALDGLARPVRREAASEPGTVIYEGYAAVEGVQPYPDVNQGADYAELVTVEALQASAQALPGLPVILGRRRNRDGVLVHPGQDTGRLELVKPDNGDRVPKVGQVLAAEVRTLDDGRRALWVRVSIFDAAAIEAIDSGEASGTSLCYRPLLRQVTGTWRGAPYAAEQTGRGPHNHLLLTNKGRGGPLCELRADADGAPMTPEEMQKLVAAIVPLLVAALVPELAKAMPAATEEPTGEMQPADMVPRADMDALQKRCDAAEAKVAELTGAAEQAQLKADAAPVGAALNRLGIKVDGFDAAKPTATGLAAARTALLDHTLRADAGERSPLDRPTVLPSNDREAVKPSSKRFDNLS